MLTTNLTPEEAAYLNEAGQWDARIGVIYISSSLTLEREWHMALPKSVSVHAARVSFPGCQSTENAINTMLESGAVDEAALKLASAEVDVIVFGCTAGTFLRGIEFDHDLCKRITEVTGGTPATTTSGGILTAVDAMGCKSINVQTPYVEELNVKEYKFLTDNGIRVNHLEGFNVVGDQDIARVEPASFVEKLTMFDRQDPADCCFISCTNSRSIEAINILEGRLNKPVISSNAVALYGALRRIGYSKPFSGYGRLFEQYL